jgi:maltose O-acetyltransferase
MLAGELYDAGDPELVADRRRCEQVLRSFNDAPDADSRRTILAELLGELGEGSEIRPPFACDYGYNIALGASVFVNFNCVILDVVQVTIGDRAQLASGVQLLAADHPLDPVARRAGPELGRPVSIGTNAWIGAGAIVCPGVSVGENSVIGAGSVVTRDIPAGVLAVGSPCRVIRELPTGGQPG